jgi:hypothetical protein
VYYITKKCENFVPGDDGEVHWKKSKTFQIASTQCGWFISVNFSIQREICDVTQCTLASFHLSQIFLQSWSVVCVNRDILCHARRETPVCCRLQYYIEYMLSLLKNSYLYRLRNCCWAVKVVALYTGVNCFILFVALIDSVISKPISVKSTDTICSCSIELLSTRVMLSS